MTTSGGSILTDFAAVDRSMMIWRQFSQWIGGMGIVVLALAVLPRLRVGGRQLMEHETPGPDLDPLTTSIRDTARRLWILYVSLTVVLALILATLGLDGRGRAHGVLRGRLVRVLDAPDRRLRARSSLGRAVRACVAVGDRALHGDRRYQLRAPVRRARPAASRARSSGTTSSGSTSPCWRSPPPWWQCSSGTPASTRARRPSGMRSSRRSRS